MYSLKGVTVPNTADKHDPSVGWTVQQDRPKPYDYDPTPGNTVRRDELPDPEVQRAAGIDPEEWGRFLAVEDEPAPTPVKKAADK